MKKLHSMALYAVVTPCIALSAGSALAQKTTTDNMDRTQQSEQRAWQPGAQTAADRRMENRGYLGATPAGGLHATNLIGTGVKTTGGDEVGDVVDLVIDGKGQIVAVVVGVGGFLGMGERNVAIGWDDVKRSGSTDELELQINVTREALRSAPEFKTPE